MYMLHMLVPSTEDRCCVHRSHGGRPATGTVEEVIEEKLS